MTNSIIRHKISAQTIMAFLLLVFGMAVVLISLYMPPQGEIHPTVITVFGMMLVAAGAFMGIDLNFQLKRYVELTSSAQRPADASSHRDNPPAQTSDASSNA